MCWSGILIFTKDHLRLGNLEICWYDLWMKSFGLDIATKHHFISFGFGEGIKWR